MTRFERVMKERPDVRARYTRYVKGPDIEKQIDKLIIQESCPGFYIIAPTIKKRCPRPDSEGKVCTACWNTDEKEDDPLKEEYRNENPSET